ncbi:Ribosomal RNA small subunit methyltransferase G [compost metagenome]
MLPMDAWQLMISEAARFGLSLDSATVEKLKRYYALLIEGNQKTNLTRIVDEREAVIKHFLDSLTVFSALPRELWDAPLSFIDVGTGGGFPGIPLLIVRPNWRGTLLEATGKKVAFLAESIQELGLNGVALHGRAEEVARDPAHRDRYDLAFARAVAEMSALSELCLPFVKVGGHFLAMKGSTGQAELDKAEKALRLLGGGDVSVTPLELPEGMGERRLISVMKQAPTPKAYPRRTGMPTQKPLG